MAAGRGALLLAVAVVLGVLLLNTADDTPTGSSTRRGGDVDTTEPPTPTTAATTTTVAVRPPRDVRVLSANGTRVNGLGARLRDALRAAGYNVLAPIEARPATSTTVYFTPGFEREAQVLAQGLRLPSNAVQPLPNPPPVSNVRGANLVAVAGPDFARQATSTTSTTRRGTTTTARSKG